MRIKVKPGSKTDEISKDAEGNIIVRIKALPVDGKANKYLIEFLADFFGLPKSHLKLLKGSTNQHKTIEIEAEEATILQKLASP